MKLIESPYKYTQQYQPTNHLMMYYRKMASLSGKEAFLILEHAIYIFSCSEVCRLTQCELQSETRPRCGNIGLEIQEESILRCI